MASTTSGALVAVYWDFENLHAGLHDHAHGNGTYGRARGRNERRADLDAIIRYISTLGDIAINRAFADWRRFSAYRDALLRHSVELVQLFSASSAGKNGADIRLALDVLQDLYSLPSIAQVVVVGGDSDYIALAQKVRQLGRRISGVGVQGSVNPHWAAACQEFRLYHTLIDKPFQRQAEPVLAGPPVEPVLARSPAEAGLAESPVEPGLAGARLVLVHTLDQLARTDGAGVHKAAVYPHMRRLDPDLDIKRLGFASFSRFVDAHADLVRAEVLEHDHLLHLTDAGRALLAESPLPGVDPAPRPPAVDAPTPVAASDAPERPALASARIILVQALAQLAARPGGAGVPKAAVFPHMRRLDPDLDIKRLGYTSFSRFVDAQADLVRVDVTDHDHLLHLTDVGHGLVAASPPLEGGASRLERYRKALRAVRARNGRVGLALAFAGPLGRALATGAHTSWDALEQEAHAQIEEAGAATLDDVRRARQALWKAGLIASERLDEERWQLTLVDGIDPENLGRALLARMLETLAAGEAEPIDPDDAASAILDEDAGAADRAMLLELISPPELADSVL